MMRLPPVSDLTSYTTTAARYRQFRQAHPCSTVRYEADGDCTKAAVFGHVCDARPLGTGLAAGAGAEARVCALGRALDAAGFRGVKYAPRPSREEMRRALANEQAK